MQTLLTGGKFFDGKNALADGVGVLVEDGAIARVAPATEFEGFSGPTIDTSWGTVMPGLIDCHVHLCLGGESDPRAMREAMDPGNLVMAGLKRAQVTLEGGITAIRDCGGKDYLEFAIRDACNSGAQMGPTIRAAGRMICMTGGHGNSIGRVADGADDVIRAVREQIHAGSDFIKLMATGGVLTPGVNPEDAHFTFEEISAGIHEAHRFNKRTASHAQGTEGILNATRGGVDSIEHGMFMTDECVEEMLARGTYLVPPSRPAIVWKTTRRCGPPCRPTSSRSWNASSAAAPPRSSCSTTQEARWRWEPMPVFRSVCTATTPVSSSSWSMPAWAPSMR